MVVLGGRERLGQPVDRRRRGGDHLADAGRDGRLDHVEGAVDQHLEREPRLLGALRDADGGLVEDHVDARHEAADTAPVADVALDQRDVPVRPRPRQVLAAAADEVVEHDDLGDAGPDELVGDRGADQARPRR